MISAIFHPGSGLGDQLFRYITARTLAEKNGTEFSMVGKEYFKGKNFINLDYGVENSISFEIQMPAGKIVPKEPVWEEGTRYYNPEINFLTEGIIDGNFQDERYWDVDKVKEWLKTEPIDMPDDLCVINFRGGEFSYIPDLFLPQEYWDKAIEEMRKINPKMEFEVHTDDPATAKKFFPDFRIWDNQMITADKMYSHMGYNWKNIRYAKYLILTNSAFGILPALMNEKAQHIIAPRYWARRNTKQWQLPQNYYKRFKYI